MTETLFTTQQLILWTSGEFFGNDRAITTFVAVDSRNCPEGSLFFCLLGERVDGHNYIFDVLKNGATGVVISRKWYSKNIEQIDKLRDEFKNSYFLIVESPLTALHKIAFTYMRGIKKPIIIGITGSNGKTTTKELVASVLSQKYSVVKTEGNLNSEIGLPLTVFNIKNHHQYAVIEMGINRIGEMDILADILRPDIVIITNIGSAHIGNFKNKEITACEKKRAVLFFTKNCKLYLNEKEPFTDLLSNEINGSVLTYGQEKIKEIYPSFTCKDIGISGWEISLGNDKAILPLVGKHNLNNAFCASVIGFDQGLNSMEILNGLKTVNLPFGRGEIFNGLVTIVNDSYNANFDSMGKFLDFAETLDWKNRKIAVIGDMKELGKESIIEHQKLLNLLFKSSLDVIFLLGEDCKTAYETMFKNLQDGNKYHDIYKKIIVTEKYLEVENLVKNEVKEGDIVFLKASRSIQLERLITPLQEKFRRCVC